MSSPARALAILDLFDEEHPVWHPDDVNAALGYTRATGYRYVRDLVDGGFLAKVGQGRYALGPRIIELDHVLRCTDPMLGAAMPAIDTLASRTGAVVVLTAMYGSRVIDVHRVDPDGGPDLEYGRGRLRPLVAGAAPKVILSWTTKPELRRLYAAHAAEFAAAGLGEAFEDVASTLKGVRAADCYISAGELEPTVGAVAVGLRGPDGACRHALALVGALDAFPLSAPDRAAQQLRGCRTEIESAFRPLTDRQQSPANPT